MTVTVASGCNARLKFVARIDGDVNETFAHISKARALLAFSPRARLEESVDLLVSWYRASAAVTV